MRFKITKDQGFACIVLVLIVLIIALSPMLKKDINAPKYYNQDFEIAKVDAILDEKLEQDAVVPTLYVGHQDVLVTIESGQYKGKQYNSQNLLSLSHNVYCTPGMKIVVGIRESDEGPQVWVYNHRRSPVIYGLTALFLILILVMGKRNGLRSILSLAFTGTMIIFVMVPLIFSGHNPSVIAILTAFITIFISFILIGGFSKKTIAAILGTWGGVLIAGLLAYICSKLANISGIHMEKGEQLIYIAKDYQIQVRGLMFASVLIASLGAIMDVAMSMASSINELHQLNKDLTSYDLIKSGMNVGRDIMGTMANTLILAFAGGSLSLILLIWGYQMSFTQLINMPFISVQIIQGLAGSIGIILSVPLTCFITTYLCKRSK